MENEGTSSEGKNPFFSNNLAPNQLVHIRLFINDVAQSQSLFNSKSFAMKNHFFVLLALALISSSNAFAQRYVYDYDNAGNRIERQFLVLRTSNSLDNKEIETSIMDISIKLYPNPASNWLHIECEHTPDRIALYDISGRKMEIPDMQSRTMTLDVAPFPSGTYFLRIRVGKQEKTWKVILL